MFKSSKYLIAITAIAFSVVISSCGSSEPVSLATSAVESTLTQTIASPVTSPSPSPVQEEPIVETATQPAGYPYPGQQLPATSISSATPYPQPGQGSDVAQIETPGGSSTSPTPYPGPGQGGLTISPTSPYPGPVTATVVQNIPGTPYPGPGSSPVPSNTPVQETPGPTATVDENATPTLTPTSTAIDVSTRLVATDPQEFKLASGGIQLVEFFAFWSPISKSMAPVVDRLEDKYGETIQFVYLDIDDPANNLFSHLLGERLPPVFFLLDQNGQVLQEWEGFVLFDQFSQDIMNVLQ